MLEVRFVLNLSAREVLRYDRGEVNMVAVTAAAGPRVRFHAANLRPYLGHGGVRGRFLLRFDPERKLVGLRRLD